MLADIILNVHNNHIYYVIKCHIVMWLLTITKYFIKPIC